MQEAFVVRMLRGDGDHPREVGVSGKLPDLALYKSGLIATKDC